MVYFSGSRALIPESDSVAGLALTFAGAEFVFAAMLVFEFVFVVVGVPQPITIKTSAMVATKQTAVDILKIEQRKEQTASEGAPTKGAPFVFGRQDLGTRC